MANISLRVVAIFLMVTFCVTLVNTHATMVYPINWFDRLNWFQEGGRWFLDYLGMRSGAMCNAGCTIRNSEICQKTPSLCQKMRNPGCSCWWYKNYTFVQKPTIFDANLLTYPHVNTPAHYLKHPWRAPGSSPVDDPCGVAGGNLHGCIGGKCAVRKGGYGYGIKATSFKFNYDVKVTQWKRGTQQEVAWGILANHGGGYSYRLCKLPKDGIRGLTEACFQKTPLKFVGNTQWAQYGTDPRTRVEFPAVRTDKGTFPLGSQWTKNPIPACNGGDGGFFSRSGNCTTGTQFPPPKPDLYGFGVNYFGTAETFKFSIVDKVYVPDDLESGDYVLSFRWDTEQTPQVWNTCASISLI